MIINNYPHQIQFLDEWCWAAVASSISLCYNNSSPWTQPALGAKFINQACSSVTLGNGPTICKSSLDILDVLKSPDVDNYAWDVAGAIRIDQVQRQIFNKWPLCCIINFGVAQHVVSIVGYVGTTLIIDDPELDQQAPIEYNDLINIGYRNGGTWAQTIGTKPKST